LISCANHDYVEIACMYKFEVKLVLKNSRIVKGKALQTTYNENREECIVLKTEIGSEKIVLEQVASMEAVRKNPHFGKINFG
jgi:Rho-binding antiterminator